MRKKISIKVITLFPKFIEQYVHFGIVERAIRQKIVKFLAIDLRSFGLDARQTVDGRPYGGGVGMVLRPDVLYKAITKSKSKSKKVKSRTILLTPQGKPFTQTMAKKLATYDELVFVSGRYEGFDERIRSFVDEEISIGDYVLMGGELPALVISEAVLRMIPGVLGKFESGVAESFTEDMLEYPQYTRPEIWEVRIRSKNKESSSAKATADRSRIKKLRVPKILLTGHHANIEAWRKEEALKRTKKRRSDLLK